MSRLTVTEKEHWKSRIENRINKAIEASETKDVTLMPSIKAKADTEAHKWLGTAKLHAKIEAIKMQQQALSNEQKQLETEMYQLVVGKEAMKHQGGYFVESEFRNCHRRQRERLENELLKESKIGREILKLRNEKDSLLDTVWLATSSAQIRDLWSRVSTVLDDDATPLQRQILSQDIESSPNE